MNKNDFLVIGIGYVLGTMLYWTVYHWKYVLFMVLCVLALRWLFSQWISEKTT